MLRNQFINHLIIYRIVEFKESSSVQKAVDLLHRYEFRGRQLVVKEVIAIYFESV